jgi:tRNA G18 (ribose-2'-O)-methylase SpoU
MEAGCEPVTILVGDKGARRLAGFARGYEPYTYLASEELRRRVTGVGVPLEVIALFRRPAPRDPAPLARTCMRGVLVDNVDNPVNVGSIARNAAAMGWDAIFLDPRSADPLARRALRVSMGNALRVPHARVADARELLLAMRARGARTVAFTPSADAMPLGALDVGDAPVLAAFGSERDGLGAELLEACTDRVRIEMAPGVDSLNVAAASAVVCYALRRWSAAETK